MVPQQLSLVTSDTNSMEETHPPVTAMECGATSVIYVHQSIVDDIQGQRKVGYQLDQPHIIQQ
ncbi:hypothetical protein DPMN_110599 [Dreissena polymorpha]|uniref:Uncharacterized protein n=1 Tax=Dreissena polymorpha TaxID=45954 RepID=A0A9D4KCD0_DREPO|nr:hypothetical protein DPMN_110599 [Dreissena polymorpha]